mmetsp:Transcript_34366/g.86261  ORF Transcript_34366/g.86261 Transcript_34366/m.86261 type:complete len:210 (-) Transcript_34366:272-901(-)
MRLSRLESVLDEDSSYARPGLLLRSADADECWSRSCAPRVVPNREEAESRDRPVLVVSAACWSLTGGGDVARRSRIMVSPCDTGGEAGKWEKKEKPIGRLSLLIRPNAASVSGDRQESDESRPPRLSGSTSTVAAISFSKDSLRRTLRALLLWLLPLDRTKAAPTGLSSPGSVRVPPKREDKSSSSKSKDAARLRSRCIFSAEDCPSVR